MRRSIVGLLLVIAGTVVYAGDVQYSGNAGGAAFGFCTATRGPRELPNEKIQPGVTYYTAPFVMEGQDPKPINAAFLAFLDKNYGYKPDPSDPRPVACTQLHTLQEAKNVQQQRMVASKKSNGQVVETGWTPTPAAQ